MGGLEFENQYDGPIPDHLRILARIGNVRECRRRRANSLAVHYAAACRDLVLALRRPLGNDRSQGGARGRSRSRSRLDRLKFLLRQLGRQRRAAVQYQARCRD